MRLCTTLYRIYILCITLKRKQNLLLHFTRYYFLNGYFSTILLIYKMLKANIISQRILLNKVLTNLINFHMWCLLIIQLILHSWNYVLFANMFNTLKLKRVYLYILISFTRASEMQTIANLRITWEPVLREMFHNSCSINYKKLLAQ